MKRPKPFVPACSPLERRIALAGAILAAGPAAAVVEALATRSGALKLNGSSPYGFPVHHGAFGVGSSIPYIQLGGRSQHLVAGGVKVPNDPSNQVLPDAGDSVATQGAKYPQFSAAATLSLTTPKGVLGLALTPAVPGSNVMRYSVASGTGTFAGAHGTGTITFGLTAKFHSDR